MSWKRTPELMEASRRTIDNQTTAPGWEDTEWSAANMICFNSFLKDGDEAHNWLQDLFHNFTRENLMTVSPAGIAGAGEDIFSFDATEASVAGICDMLLQSYDGYVEFLPALPSAWDKGSVKGLCVEGGLVADLDWNNGRMTAATLTASVDSPLRLAMPEGSEAEFSINGKPVKARKDKEGLHNFSLKSNDRLSVKF